MDKLISDSLYAMQQFNLVYNYNFKYYSNKTGKNPITFNHPDGWIYNDAGPGGQISLYEENCRIVTSSDNTSLMSLRQNLHEFPRWQSNLCGKLVTAKVHLTISKNCVATITFSDGIRSCIYEISDEGSTVTELPLNVNANAEKLYISIESLSNSAVISISKIYANIGAMAIENLPCIVNGIIGERKQYVATENAPDEELSLCDSLELEPSKHTRLNSVMNHRFGKGDNGMSLLPDTRGYFSRAWNNGANIDTDASGRTMLNNESLNGDHVGTSENDVFLKHSHGLNFSTDNTILTGDKGAAIVINTTKTSSTKTEADGKETRPKNIAELYTIKWA